MVGMTAVTSRSGMPSHAHGPEDQARILRMSSRPKHLQCMDGLPNVWKPELLGTPEGINAVADSIPTLDTCLT